MLLYECAPKSRQVPLLEKASSERGAACYSPAMPPEWDSCLTPIVAWAVGSQGIFNSSKVIGNFLVFAYVQQTF